MDAKRMKVVHVFEENVCRICAQAGVHLYYNINENFIQYKNVYISFLEIIKDVLNFEIDKDDGQSMEICDLCKNKLTDFYHFKRKSADVRKMQEESLYTPKSCSRSILDLDSKIEDKTTYDTVQIVRNYIEKYFVSSIKFVEADGKLIIMPSIKDIMEPETILIKEEPENNVLDDFDIFPSTMSQPSSSKHYETVIDDLNPDDEEDEENSSENEDSEFDDKTFMEQMEEEEYEEAQDFIEQNSMKIDSNYKSIEQPTYTIPVVIKEKKPDHWKQSRCKTLRNSGQSYVNNKGKLVAAKQMRESCGLTCRMKCEDKIDDENRLMNFNNYYELADTALQWEFIVKHSKTVDTKRSSTYKPSEPTDPPKKIRTSHHKYYLEKRVDHNEYEMIQVCKKMFLNTLSISNQVANTVFLKVQKEGSIEDRRGNTNRRVSEGNVAAKEHVQRYPFFYIEQNMTVVQLYDLYKDECEEKNIVPVAPNTYRQILKENYDFLKTTKIVCEFCHKYFNSSEKEKLQMQQEFDEHTTIQKKCRDRALGRIRNKRGIQRRRELREAKKLAAQAAAIQVSNYDENYIVNDIM